MQVYSKCDIRLACIAMALAISGCKTLNFGGSDTKEKSPPPENSGMKIPVGTVHHVDAEEGFLLVRSSRSLDIEPGTTITIFGNGGIATATAEVSPARKGQFLTADIRQGMPTVGEQVVMDYKTPAPPDPAATGTPFGGEREVQVLE